MLADSVELQAPLEPGINLSHEERMVKKSDKQFRGYSESYKADFMNKMMAPHTESFNFFLTKGLKAIVQNSKPYTFLANETSYMTISLLDLKIGSPQYNCPEPLALTPQICREQSISYTAPLTARFQTEMSGKKIIFQQAMGNIPILVGCNKCITYRKTPQELVKLREDEREAGGYFLSNGTERVIRMVVIPKHMQMQNMERTAYQKRGSAYTQFAVSFRDRRDDCRSQTIVLHALKDGSCNVRMMIAKKEYFLPLCLVLKALKPTTDYEIYNQIVQSEQEVYIIERVEMMLRDFHAKNLRTSNEALQYIGEKFRNICFSHRADLTDVQIAQELFANHLFFSFSNNQDKYNLLCQMARRLYLFTEGKLVADNQDSTANHDVLLVGHLFTALMSEQVALTMQSASWSVMRLRKLGKFEYDEEVLSKIFKQSQIENAFHSLISTGNLNSPSGLDLLQQDSFSVSADRLNFVRFFAHFRSIHRGKFFSEMKTTAVRKMLPESYGFLCPVHTPDGAPCGLLNHLCYNCQVVVDFNEKEEMKLLGLCRRFGVAWGQQGVPVFLNGKVIGFLPEDGMVDECSGEVYDFVQMLRGMKCRGEIDPTTEIAYTPSCNKYKMYPSLAILNHSGRYTRTVFNLAEQKTEQISPFEQLQLDIAIYDHEFHPQTTHQELAPISMLSAVASMVPFPDHNQSPRNMYECQMLKQTMGFSARSIGYRVDSKNYRILTPQKPMVRNCIHEAGGFDSHPTGTNAVVAVLSYSGYDMEDACLINKSSLERGLFNGTVYQCEDIDLSDQLNIAKRSSQTGYFRGDGSVAYIDMDGMPHIGAVITPGDSICQYYDPTRGTIRNHTYEGKEIGIVEKVIITRDHWVKLAVRCKIIIRHDRSPIIGDKFASRHGQKGTLGIKFFGRDMPFSHESGIAPDLIINPHAFPSRMTVGMLLESLGGKLASMNCTPVDSTPFNYGQDMKALDVLGEQLLKYGFCKYGSDVMYSGVTGEMMPVNVFIGVVYYQRLRHMVNDKYQVRGGIGPIDQITHQPIKGRKRGGGTRFGEMERDALLAHGTQSLLRGRLCTDSDAHVFSVCSKCGNVLNKNRHNCSLCNGELKKIVMPMVTGVLICELAGMGIMMQVKVE